MADNYNFPAGADADPRAPWNQPDAEMLDCPLCGAETEVVLEEDEPDEDGMIAECLLEPNVCDECGEWMCDACFKARESTCPCQLTPAPES